MEKLVVSRGLDFSDRGIGDLLRPFCRVCAVSVWLGVPVRRKGCLLGRPPGMPFAPSLFFLLGICAVYLGFHVGAGQGCF